MNTKTIFLALALCFSATGLMAQQFTYKPISPFFGGDTFNYGQILSSAQAQNGLRDPGARVNQPRTQLQRFADNLNNQLFNQFSRQLTMQQLAGINFDEPGTFTAGDFAIEIFESDEGLVINILDTTTGEESQIIVPN